MRSKMICLFSVWSLRLGAQEPTAVLVGTVRDASTRRPISSATIDLPALRLSATTNDSGRFAISAIHPGKHEVVIRRVGFSPRRVTVTMVGSDTVRRQFELMEAAVLESVVVTSSVISSFEEHRALGLGSFITTAELERQRNRRLSDVLTQLRGVKIISGRSNRAWIANKRGVQSLNPRSCGVSDGRFGAFERGLDAQDVRMGARPCECYSLVYLDRAQVYRGSQLAGEPLFDVNSIPVDQIEAIEFYWGPAELPAMYAKLNSPCGVLVIHTRK
jgi:hypothetical protein